MSELLAGKYGFEAKQDFDAELEEGSKAEQGIESRNNMLHKLFGSIDPDEIAELKRKNREQADF